MSEFSELYAEIVKMCSRESISVELSRRLGQVCTAGDTAKLVKRLLSLDAVDLEDDPGEGSDFHWRLRTSISDALAAAGEIAAGPLLAVLESSDGEAAQFAARSLGRIRSRQAVGPILAKIRSASDHSARLFYITALGEIGDTRVIDDLLPYLQRSGDLNGGWLVRVTAEALGMLGDPSVLGPLCTVLASDGSVFARLGAAEGLGLLGHADALPHLKRALGDSDHRVVEAARESIEEIRRRNSDINGQAGRDREITGTQ